MADGLRMIVARSCYRHGVFPECQATVSYDNESLHVVGHRQIDAGHRYRQPVGCVGVYREAELRIICVLVVLYPVAGDDISHRTAVDCNRTDPEGRRRQARRPVTDAGSVWRTGSCLPDTNGARIAMHVSVTPTSDCSRWSRISWSTVFTYLLFKQRLTNGVVKMSLFADDVCELKWWQTKTKFF